MGIIDLKLVQDYVEAKRISKKKINSLEDDVEYMMLTMIKTNDPKMYRFCSEKVKQDYAFVKFYVNKFRDNFEFVDAAARYYIENSKSFINVFELNIMMMEIANENGIQDFQYGLSSLCRFFVIDAYHTSIANRINLEGEVLNQLYGLGFNDVIERFSGSEVIVNYLAKRKIEELVLRHHRELEIELHKNFDSSDSFKEYFLDHYNSKENVKEEIQNPFCDRKTIDGYKLYQIMLSFISRYDETLSLYTQSRLELLEPMENALSKIYAKWQMYDYELERVQYQAIIDLYEENYERFEYAPMFGKYDMLQFVGRELGIDNIFNEYVDPEQYMFVGYFDPETNRTFEKYMADCVCSSKQNIETYNRLLDAIDAIIKSRTSEDALSVQMDECKVTRLRSVV